MTGKKEKTISGAMYSAPNLKHNLRTHIPPNSVEERRHLNRVYTKYMRSYLLSRIKSGGIGRLRKGAVKDFHRLIMRRLSRISRSIFVMRLFGR